MTLDAKKSTSSSSKSWFALKKQCHTCISKQGSFYQSTKSPRHLYYIVRQRPRPIGLQRKLSGHQVISQDHICSIFVSFVVRVWDISLPRLCFVQILTFARQRLVRQDFFREFYADKHGGETEKTRSGLSRKLSRIQIKQLSRKRCSKGLFAEHSLTGNQ